MQKEYENRIPNIEAELTQLECVLRWHRPFSSGRHAYWSKLIAPSVEQVTPSEGAGEVLFRGQKQ